MSKRAFLACLGTLGLLVYSQAGCVLDVHSIEGPTGGGGSFPGMASIWNRPGVTRVSVLVVHGISTHLVGYSKHLQERLVPAMDLPWSEQLWDACRDLPLNPGGASIRFCRYGTGERVLDVFEVTWSPLSTPLKTAFLGHDESVTDRVWLDDNLKKRLINDGFADAVIYAGAFKSELQKPIEYALCMMLDDDLTERALRDARLKSSPPCTDRGRRDEGRTDRAFALVSESLGSTMVWETLVKMHEMDKSPVPTEILKDTRMIFMLANQLPLLALARVRAPMGSQAQAEGSAMPSVFPDGLPGMVRDALIRRRNERLKQGEALEADGPISVVTMSDPNDLLGYSIPQSMALPDLFVLTNVRISISRFAWFSVVVNPLRAHEGHIDNDRILEMITCGQPAKCGPR